MNNIFFYGLVLLEIIKQEKDKQNLNLYALFTCSFCDVKLTSMSVFDKGIKLMWMLLCWKLMELLTSQN